MANSAPHRDWILMLACMLVVGLGANQSAQAQTFTVLYNFTGYSDGELPLAGLVQGAAGNLYGTTFYGGSSGSGLVFKINTSGTETVFHSFTGSDGAYPKGGLIRDNKGNFYGTTEGGGAHNYGTVFRLSKTGKETVTHSFNGRDGESPYGGLLWDDLGNLYGTTYHGGDLTCGFGMGCGTVFRLSQTGKETVLHRFTGRSDGAYPTGLIIDAKGNLYGVTGNGGDVTCGSGSGCGVVYKMSNSGTETVLHAFLGGAADGCGPIGIPAMDKKGDLYGTTQNCGYSGAGTVWKVSQKGAETVLHSFNTFTDGGSPPAGVIMDAGGNLYGDTYQGGTSFLGTVYELNENGTLTVLHTFTGSDGENPQGGVIRDIRGNLYGTASAGGSSGYGTVWMLTP